MISRGNVQSSSFIKEVCRCRCSDIKYMDLIINFEVPKENYSLHRVFTLFMCWMLSKLVNVLNVIKSVICVECNI